MIKYCMIDPEGEAITQLHEYYIMAGKFKDTVHGRVVPVTMYYNCHKCVKKYYYFELKQNEEITHDWKI